MTTDACRRCSDCPGQEHHWIEANDRRCSRYVCKHCEAQCFAVDDEEDPLGGYRPSGLVIEVTDAMREALDRMRDAMDDSPGGLALDQSRWLLEEIASYADLRLIAIEDGEIPDDEEDEDAS